MEFRGLDLTHQINRLKAGFLSVCVNVRAYAKGAITSRNLLADAIYTLGDVVHSIRRLNDSTPNGPVSGYTVISGAGTTLYNGNTSIATGLSGNPVSLIPFRPNTSPQVFMYVADSAVQGSVSLNTNYLISGLPVSFPSNGMMKVRSDGLVYKMGVKEPQLAPLLSTGNIVTSGTDSLPATTIPWSNVAGANTTNYGYGQTSAGNGTAAVIITGGGPELVAGSSIVLTVTGTATVGPYGTVGPATSGNKTASYPAQYVTGASSIILGAFTDASGNVVAPGGSLPLVFSIGAGVTVTVPTNAAQLHIGVDSAANTFSANSGSFTINWQVTIHPIASTVSTVGQVTAYVWGSVPGGTGTGGGSPHSGPVAQYIWKNPNDGGSGIPRSISNPVPDVSPTNNSWTFCSTSTATVDPANDDDSTPVNWSTLNPDGTTASTIPLFTPALEPEGNYADFNVCVVGSLFIPAAGTHTFTLQYKDQIAFGIGGGAEIVGSVSNSLSNGQTITVVNSLPILFGSTANGSGSYQTTTITVSFSGAGIYSVEIDWDYWYHTGRALILTCDGAIINPISANIREDVQYRYVYRSSATGAQSNPSPESTAQALPVIANSVTSYWSNDPQIDVVDYYRLDSATTSFTYVATGPNDNVGGGLNTPIVDLLSDLELGNQLLNYDNFEPYPSIDLPQKGTCSISGGVITWLSGGAIGGSTTGFNVRWLAGTTILIGSPTSLAYILVARPTSTASMTIPGVPDGTNLAYEITAPVLGAQPLPHMMGPTDNINFVFGWGDKLRPGVLAWCEGNNLDSWPDTNQQDITDPNESLVGGDIAGPFGVIGSTKRFWIIVPNFSNSVATVTGTEGSTWTLEKTSIDRGLFMEWCVAVEGNKFFFRVSDGIHCSSEGQGSQSITDETLYPLFQHEGSVPAPVTRQGVTVWPPDDSLPQLQKFKCVNGYLYYDYQGTDGNPHTLVFSIESMAWVWDVSTPSATCHATNEGVSIAGTLVGCQDHTVRLMSSAGTEMATSNIQSAAVGGKGWQHLGMMVVEYSSTAAITLNCYPADTGNGSYGPATITLAPSATLTKFWFRPSPNKWKLMTFNFSSTAPFNLNMDGAVAYIKAWGVESEYLPVPMFGTDGGEG